MHKDELPPLESKIILSFEGIMSFNVYLINGKSERNSFFNLRELPLIGKNQEKE